MGNCCYDRKDKEIQQQAEDRTIEPQVIDLKQSDPIKYSFDTLPVSSLHTSLEY